MALVVTECVVHEVQSLFAKSVKYVLIFSVIVLSVKNLSDYYNSYKIRTHNIVLVNSYLGKYNLKNATIVGAWAPSLCWNSKALCFPIWKDYFNDKDVLKLYSPTVVIAETNEEDSNGAFASNGIAIDTYADSIKYFTINHWKVKLLWINQQRSQQ